MHRDVMQFALNLPWSLRQNKPLLREEFLQHWPPELLFAKQGFTGHANDGLPWMSVTVVDQGDRHQTWKQIAKTTFYNYTGSSH
jgi:hypothetical protein